MESIRGRFVFLIQSTFAPAENLMELLLMIDAAKRASLIRSLPLFPIMVMRGKTGRISPAWPLGLNWWPICLLQQVPTAWLPWTFMRPKYKAILTYPSITLIHQLFSSLIESLNLQNLTFAAPDVGEVQTVYARSPPSLKCDMVICDKHRKRANEIASMVVIGDVTDRDIVLIDDICDTGGTLAKAPDLYDGKRGQECRGHVYSSGAQRECLPEY